MIDQRPDHPLLNPPTGHTFYDEMSNGLVIFKGLIFSDLAIKDAASGKLSLINIFSQLNVMAFPFQSPIFYMTALITNMAGPVEKLSFKVEIVGANEGPKLAEVSGRGTFQPVYRPRTLTKLFRQYLPCSFRKLEPTT